MTDGWIFLGISFAICLGVFLNGLRFARAAANPWTGKQLFGQPVSGGEMPLAKVRRLGWIQMIGAVTFLVFAAALSFGLLGPVEGIRTIDVR